MVNPYEHILKSFESNGRTFKYYDVSSLGNSYGKLPYSIRVLLESAVRNCDNFQVQSIIFMTRDKREFKRFGMPCRQ
ncbi:IRP1A [Caligus rogercresseyi]|uniref:IRP1A n=1 Tax=Caligus rogercresseyi TaxID=217165 RepID=A0A7T8QVQ9_CALRO|nr:IRP1A [Caligus rogercresseyi]